MKQYRMIVVVLLLPGILFLLSTGYLTVLASNTQREQVEQIEGILDVSVFYQQGKEYLIKCFDVNVDGSYAIGYKNNTIHVYDSLGIFQYGYQFSTEGTYGIVLKEDTIVIYLGRSNIAVEIDKTGKCLCVENVYFTKDVVDNVTNRTYKQIGKVTYRLERDIGIFHGDYSRLVKIDENGERIVLYDVTEKGYWVGIFHYILLGILPITVVAAIVKKVKKEDYKASKEIRES